MHLLGQTRRHYYGLMCGSAFRQCVAPTWYYLALSAADHVRAAEALRATMTLPLQVVIPNTVSAGQASSFNSYGPALDLSFKPDLAAPGNLIVSPVCSAHKLFITAQTQAQHSSVSMTRLYTLRCRSVAFQIGLC